MRRIFAYTALLLSCVVSFCQAERPDVSGYLESRHAVQTRSSNDILASETRLRLEAGISGENTSAFISGNLSKSHLEQADDTTTSELHEAYIDFAGNGWDLRAGRQIIIWGNSDGVQVTDVLCPSDLSEFATRDLDEIRLPVDALNIRYTGSGDVTLEAVLIPFFEAAQLPDSQSPWRVGPASPLPNTPETPDRRIGNGEAGVRASWFLPGADISLSWARIWNDLPVKGETGLSYKRTSFAGLTASIPLDAFVLRGEAAWFSDAFKTAADGGADIETPLTRALVGIDWYPGGSWTLSMQFLQETALENRADMAADGHSELFTFRASKKVMREKIEISDMAYVTANDLDLFNRFSVDFEVEDGFHIMGGCDLFFGPSDSSYGRYRDNTQVWARAKFHF